ncbi:MAG: hypothetical protein H6623_05760 [Bdellovibrionaceae bacterium]|nr:hypothetical protein [Pseudobdellovibrionaceae bacterium]
MPLKDDWTHLQEEQTLLDMVQAETTCCLCTTPLAATYQVDYQTLKINETLYCENCDLTLKNATHTLH